MGQLQHNAGGKILHHNGDHGTNGVIMHDCCCGDVPDCNSCDPVMSKTYTATITVVSDPSPGANCALLWEDNNDWDMEWAGSCTWSVTKRVCGGEDCLNFEDCEVSLSKGGTYWKLVLRVTGLHTCSSVDAAEGPNHTTYDCEPEGSYTGGNFQYFGLGEWTAVVS